MFEELFQRDLERRNFLRRVKSGKANWIGNMLPRNCLIKQVIEEKRRKM